MCEHREKHKIKYENCFCILFVFTWHDAEMAVATSDANFSWDFNLASEFQTENKLFRVFFFSLKRGYSIVAAAAAVANEPLTHKNKTQFLNLVGNVLSIDRW